MSSIKPRRILHVVGAMNRAGTETMLMNIYRNINHEIIQFDFISYGKEDAHYDQEIRQLGGRVIKLSNTQSIKQLYRAIKQYGPYNAVHAHTLFHCGIANLAARIAGVPVRIAHAHTTADNEISHNRKVYIKLMRIMIQIFSTNLLACSNESGKYLFGESGVKKATYSYFPNAINYLTFMANLRIGTAKLKLEEGLGNSLVIGHIGRFIEAKNHAFLIEIMKSVVKRDPIVKLLLVGDGDLRHQIEDKAKAELLYENIRFVGVRSDISNLLHCMDVFVFPSIYEGLGLVLLEAQASGVPCVVSEAIQPEADLELGLVSKLALSDGPEVWANKIIEQAGKKEKNKNLIADSFKTKGYSLSAGITKLTALYNLKDGGSYEKSVDRFL
ncbi:glycosyltransferase family 1 protein [Virgibacillus sp. DJP39]|uniref:glycosyltransferase family 1 protein n=1 Tax=Virgibacillus sp. DJP39 TaxID=3409790 RepID=UPI003BB78683